MGTMLDGVENAEAGRRYKIFVDGQDVSHRCFSVDRRSDPVVLQYYREDSSGHVYREGSKVVTREIEVPAERFQLVDTWSV